MSKDNFSINESVGDASQITPSCIPNDPVNRASCESGAQKEMKKDVLKEPMIEVEKNNNDDSRDLEKQMATAMQQESLNATSQFPAVTQENNSLFHDSDGYKSSLSSGDEEDSAEDEETSSVNDKAESETSSSGDEEGSDTSSEEETSSESEDEPEYQLYKEQLEPDVEEKKALNILLLGETGVGKSTWINGISNYLTFKALTNAFVQPICLIPTKFTLIQSEEDDMEVTLDPSNGTKDDNETFSDQGQSSTQDPKTYKFETSKYIINMIDTPGIGDIRGPEHDNESIQKILNAVANYDQLHAICFLFKVNDTLMTPRLQSCISELLLQFHKNAIDNISFLFTNSQETSYRPGSTMAQISEFLTKLKNDHHGTQILLSKTNTFFIDNDAFRHACAYHNGERFYSNEYRAAKKNWFLTSAESHRFFEFVADRKPYNIADTVLINKIRNNISRLAEPLALLNKLMKDSSDDRLVKNEYQNLIDCSLPFGSFLLANAILPYNDAFTEYAEKFINEKEMGTDVGRDESKYEKLRQILHHCHQEIAMLKAAAKNPSSQITSEEIDFIKRQLEKVGSILEKDFQRLLEPVECKILPKRNHVIVPYKTAAGKRNQPFQDNPRPSKKAKYSERQSGEKQKLSAP